MQLDNHQAARVVFQRLEVLQGQRLHGLQFVVRQMGTAEDIGIDFQCGV